MHASSLSVFKDYVTWALILRTKGKVNGDSKVANLWQDGLGGQSWRPVSPIDESSGELG